MLYPRVPERRAVDEDAETPRICVAPTIAACLRMTAWNDDVNGFHVYALKTDPRDAGLHIPTGRIPDLGRTDRHQEYWLDKRSRFVWLGQVNMSRVDLITGRPCYYWSHTLGISQPEDRDCMTADQRKAFLDNEDYHHRMREEMAEELASGSLT